MSRRSNDLSDIMSSWNSFHSEEPCSVVNQPVRQEDSELSREYKRVYEWLRLGDTFYPEQPCIMPDQPVRHEEKRQKAKYRAKCREIYQDVRFGDDNAMQVNEMGNSISLEKAKVKSYKSG